MPRGHQDWLVNTGQLPFVDRDVLEAIAREGAPCTFIRSGRAVYVDTFDSTLGPWYFTVRGTGSAAAIVTTGQFRGAGCLKLTPGSDGAFSGTLAKDMPLILSGRMGFEMMVWHGLLHDVLSMTVYIVIDEVLQTYAVYYDAENARIYVVDWDSGGDIVYDGFGDVRNANPAYHLIKMVIDTDKQQYVQIQFDNKILDASAYTPEIAAQAVPDYLGVRLVCSDGEGTQGPVYVDDFLITVDEP